jgi:hypothetical protein
VPIACTLTAEDATQRVQEWRLFLNGSVDAAVRETDTQLRLRLKSPRRDLLVAVDLAQREKACCGFFQFSLIVDSDTCWLVIGVPQEATAALSGFVDLLPSR